MSINFRRAAILAGLFALVLAGCGAGDNGLNKGGKLTGRATIDGKPLKGGNVIVVSENGKYSVQGYINGEGIYTVLEPPLGKVKIAVQTSHLRDSVVPKNDPGKGKGKGIDGSRGMTLPDPKELGLGFTAIPARYEKAETAGLTTEVKSGDQAHDIELTSAP